MTKEALSNMNRLDDEEDSLHLTHGSLFPFQAKSSWYAVERLGSIIGEEAVSALLSVLDENRLHTPITNSSRINLMQNRNILLCFTRFQTGGSAKKNVEAAAS